MFWERGKGFEVSYRDRSYVSVGCQDIGFFSLSLLRDLLDDSDFMSFSGLLFLVVLSRFVL